MKIAIVTCYNQKGYVRTRTLTAGLKSVQGVEIVTIENTQTGILRYPEVGWKILVARFKERPDAYLVNFRGYEMLLYMVLTGVRKPIIFDEFINFTEWMDEHQHIRPRTWQYQWFRSIYGWFVRRSAIVLADTAAHATYSSKLNRMPLERYYALPVGTDESVFYPTNISEKAEKFTVFYYGNMLPLHGLPYVLEAAKLLAGNAMINFRFIGGGKKIAGACEEAAKAGAQVSYESWLPFEDIPEAARQASLTLGGPFGDTLQAQFVITGKTYQFLALGAPVLIGRNKANEVFVDKHNSLVAAQANAQAIAEAITWAYEHPEALKKIGSSGRQLYEKDFSQKHINEHVKKVIAQLTEKQS